MTLLPLPESWWVKTTLGVEQIMCSHLFFHSLCLIATGGVVSAIRKFALIFSVRLMWAGKGAYIPDSSRLWLVKEPRRFAWQIFPYRL